MRRLAWLTAVLILGACGSPPSRPEFLWESVSPPDSPSGSGTARSMPAKVWEGEGPSDNISEEAGDDSVGTPVEKEPANPIVLGSVMIQEIYYDAVGSDTEGLLFVELFGDPDLPIGGLQINFVDGGDGSIDDSITLPELARIGLDGYYVIADLATGATQNTTVSYFDLLDNFDPQNGPDAVQLLDAEGRFLDAVAYGPVTVLFAENGLPLGEGNFAPDVVNGHSVERSGLGVDTNDNAADFTDRDPPTPGQ